MIRRLIIALVLCGAAWGQTCNITSDANPPLVSAGATHAFTTNCGSPVWSVTGPGSINSSTGVYTAPATFWAQDVSRGWQILPQNNVYKLPLTGLSTDSRSSYWMQRVADNCPSCPSYHTFKIGPKLNFYDNVVTNSTPTQTMHFSNSTASQPYQNTAFPIPALPSLAMQNGWHQDILVGLDRHMFSINNQTGDDAEIYNIFTDYQTISITTGNPTVISYTTHTISTLQTPIRVYITGLTGACAVLNGNFLANVSSQVPGTSGVLSVPVNTTGMTCTGTPKMTGCSGSVAGCNTCNSIGGQHWFPNSNAITGGTDAGGSPFSASSIHTEEWWNVVQQNILDPACNCVTLGHALRTTLSNSYISPRNLWPAILGNLVTGGHPNNALTAVTIGATTQFTTSANISTFQPCSGFTYAAGCTFPIVIGNQGAYTGTWSAANGNWTATAVDNTHFTIALNSAGFPALPAGGTFIFDWLPYGAHIRLKGSFDVAGFCAGGTLTPCPYEKAILNTLKVYGMVLMDGTIPGDNWDSGIVASEFQPDQLVDAEAALRTSSNFQSIEQYLEVAAASGQQLNFLPYTNPNNQIGLTANNRVTVTVSQSGHTSSSLDVQLLGTAIGTDHERLSMVTGTTYQINYWLTGNASSAVTFAMSPAVSGASVSGTGLITAPSSLSVVTKTTVTITSTADSTANAYIDVFFIPVSGDSKIRLAIGQQATSYTDSGSVKWWGQVVPRGFNTFYENAEGVGLTGLLGTYDGCPGCWSGTTDAKLYGMSTSAQNDQNLLIVIPNGSYGLTLYGEAGYGITTTGKNVYDVEINGAVAASFQDGFTLSGGVYKGYQSSYPATVSTGLLQLNFRIRQYDTGGHGASVSSLLISPGGVSLAITTSSLPGGALGVMYSQPLAAVGGSPPYTWSLNAGVLPTGTSLSSAGVISGIPVALGTFSFTVQVCDTVPTCVTKPLSILIAGSGPIITTTTLPAGVQGVAYSTTLHVIGGLPPYFWSVIGGAVPGLTINSGTGVYSGTPTLAGIFGVTFEVTDTNNVSAVTPSPLKLVISSGGTSGNNIITGGSITSNSVIH